MATFGMRSEKEKVRFGGRQVGVVEGEGEGVEAILVRSGWG